MLDSADIDYIGMPELGIDSGIRRSQHGHHGRAEMFADYYERMDEDLSWSAQLLDLLKKRAYCIDVL